MGKSFIALLVALAGCMPVSGASSGLYHYDNFALDSKKWSRPYSILISAEGKWILVGSERFDYESCESARYYVCLTSAEFDFAVPKDVAVGSQWSVGETSFSTPEMFNFVRYGKSDTVFRIRGSRQSGRDVEFLYSIEAGLLAIDDYAQQRTSVQHYGLREAIGLGGYSP